MQADKLCPYRQKELLKRLSDVFAGKLMISSHDL